MYLRNLGDQSSQLNRVRSPEIHQYRSGIQQSTDQHTYIYEETIDGQGKNYLKKLEVTVTNTYTALGIVPVPTNHSGKPYNSRNLRVEYLEINLKNKM